MTEALPQRVGLYCRLSYAPDGSLEKVERQEADCRELSQRLSWTVSESHVFVDNSRSAWQRNRKRPAWDAMLKALDAGEIDAIIVYHGDRLMRQPYDLEKLLSVAERKGIRLASPSGVRDLDSPDDRFILRIEVAQACRESDNTSRRVIRALKARAEKGLTQVGGSRPFGYGVQVSTRTVDDPETGAVREVPVYDTTRQVPEEAELLKEAVDRLLAGQSQIGVVKWLNTKCATTEGNAWTTKTFRDLLLRPRIAGLIEQDGLLSSAAWDGIITAERWQDVKALYQRNGEKYRYAGRDRVHLLSTVAECGGCATVMRGRPVGGKDKPRRRTRYMQYYCPGCKKVSRKTDAVDAYVQGRVLSLLQDRRFVAELRAAMETGAPGISAQITELEERKRKKAAQLEELADDPDLDPVLAMRALASFDRRLAALRAQLTVSVEQRSVQRCVGMTREEWLAEPVDVRATVVKSLFRVVILPTSRRGPGFDPSSVQLTRRSLEAAPAPGGQAVRRDLG
ncbi:recombinase family protein [Streptomyces stelliscabiei]|uniref:recombinase family protein n=1 Tax=Streptomyces stelliscabiei TaxID=146820 RepID=UPI0029AE85FE|nr:recombinase family protein [Streptomyces stelliscabiei]MDX2667371.1 recombinase family protein [Streptomyces stelliscabiei]MDX2785910.1 recombinase family protein [Streptomyces stelliscabiei]